MAGLYVRLLCLHEACAMKLSIKWLDANKDCETDGCSGGWAEGAEVRLNGVLIHSLVPVATCFFCGDGDNWSEVEVYKTILAGLGYEIEESY